MAGHDERIGPATLIVGTAVAFGLHLFATRHVGGPSVVYDEAGYLGNARWLVGGATWEMPFSPTYAVGYSIVIAPVMAIFHTADAQWRAIMVINAALLASLFPLLATIAARVLGAGRRVAVAGAALGAAAPAATAAGVSAIAENLVLPLVAASVLAARAMVRRDDGSPMGWPYGYGACIAALVTTHDRFTGVVAVAVVALVVAERRSIVRRSVAVVNGSSMLVLIGLGRLLDRAVVEARWRNVESLQGSPYRWSKLVDRPAGWGELSLTAVGQAWYLAVGSMGLAVVGLLAAWRLVRSDGSDEADRGRFESSARARRFAVGVTLAGAAAVFVTSVVFFAQNQFRADHWVYGRHNDSFTPLWLLLATTSLLMGAGRRRRTATGDAGRSRGHGLGDLVVAAGVIAVSGATLIIWRDPGDLGNAFSPFAVPALYRAIGSQPNATFWRATAFALVGSALIALALVVSDPARARPRSGAVIVVVGLGAIAGWFTFTGYGVVATTERYQDVNSTGFSVPTDVARLGIDRLEVEGTTARSLPMLTYPFWLPNVDVTTYDADEGETPIGPFVAARLDDLDRRRAGDRVASIDNSGFYAFYEVPEGIAIWVRPGQEQDRLDAAGLLLPPDFPAPLPEAARKVMLTISGDTGDSSGDPPVLRVRPGGSVVLSIDGRHTGSGSPWPGVTSYPFPERVRLIAQITPQRPGDPIGARTGGELSNWVDPGTTFRSQVEVLAVDFGLGPLPAGRYDVQLGVGQDGEGGWFAPGGPAARFVMEVTE